MDKLYIIMPAYNERENIAAVIAQWHPIVSLGGKGSKLVVINDGSKDDTLQVCKKLKSQFPNFSVLDKPNSGHGPTLLYGYQYALEQGADYIFQTDSDGQTDSREFEEVWHNRKRYDICIGIRNGRQDGLSRIFVTKILKIVLWLIFQIDIPDANTPFRLISRNSLIKYLAVIPKDFFLSNVMMTVAAVYYKDRVFWKEITFKQRRAGVNSINLQRIFKIGFKALFEFSEAKRVLTKSIVYRESDRRI